MASVAYVVHYMSIWDWAIAYRRSVTRVIGWKGLLNCFVIKVQWCTAIINILSVLSFDISRLKDKNLENQKCVLKSKFCQEQLQTQATIYYAHFLEQVLIQEMMQ